MAKDPVKDLTGSVRTHFDQAVARPVRATLDVTEKVGGTVRDLYDRGTKAAQRLIAGEPPPKRRTTDIVLPPSKGKKR